MCCCWEMAGPSSSVTSLSVFPTHSHLARLGHPKTTGLPSVSCESSHGCCFKMVVVQSLSCVSLFCSSVDCSAPGSSVGFSRQEYWSGLPFPSPGIFPTHRSNAHLLHWQAVSLPLSHEGSPSLIFYIE